MALPEETLEDLLDGILSDDGGTRSDDPKLDAELDDFLRDMDPQNEYDVEIEVMLGVRDVESPLSMTADVTVSSDMSILRSPVKTKHAVSKRSPVQAPSSRPAKKQRTKKKGRKELPKTTKLKYGWTGNTFTGCVRVQAKGDLVHEKWTKPEVESKMDEMIGKWNWEKSDSDKHSKKNVARWLRKAMNEHGSDWFRPQDVVINKMDYSNRRRPTESTAKFYPPYDALCCGYEVRRCPFTEMDDERNKMRLSPVFVERLRNIQLMQ